jgi:flagellar biosynthetic protein FliO
MVNSLAALALVFGLLGAALFWVRRVGGGRASGPALGVVDAVQLGSGRSLAVVRSGERYFLVGATPHSISLIAELAAGELAAALSRPAPAANLSTWPGLTARMRSLRNMR